MLTLKKGKWRRTSKRIAANLWRNPGPDRSHVQQFAAVPNHTLCFWTTLFFKWTSMLSILFSFPLQILSSTFSTKGCLLLEAHRPKTIPHIINKKITHMNCFQPIDLLLDLCCCDRSPCQWALGHLN